MDQALVAKRPALGPWGLLAAGGFVACAATATGFFGGFWWPLDLASHFRAQYFLGLSLLAVVFALGGRPRPATTCAAFALINFLTIVPLYFGPRAATPTPPRPLRALLANVNTRSGDVEAVKSLIRHCDPDLILLEELDSQWVADLESLRSSHPHTVLQPREDNFGIALFSRLRLENAEVVYLGEAEVPSVTATVITHSGRFHFLGTHPVPPVGAEYTRWRNDQLARIPDFLDGRSEPQLLLGDLNASPWSYHFRRLLRRAHLRDSVRGHGFQPTWPAGNPLMLIPLDHCLYSRGIHIVGREVGPDIRSDHYPLIVDFVVDGLRSTESRRRPAK